MDKEIKYYKAICESEGKSRDRRYSIVKYMYIDSRDDDIIPSYEEAEEKFELNIRTVGRDIIMAIEDLSILFFRIDGIKL